MYFQEASEPIPDFLMLRASQIQSTGYNSTSPTRALWCQSANINSNNGTWFQPPGFSMVSSEDIDSPTNEPYQMVTCPGQVGLVRDIGLAATDSIGLVQCVIRDEMNTTHTLTVGVYNATVYDNYGEQFYYHHTLYNVFFSYQMVLKLIPTCSLLSYPHEMLTHPSSISHSTPHTDHPL